MSLASTARYNSAVTNSSWLRRAAVTVRPIPSQVEEAAQAKAEGRYAMSPNYEVIAECGHRVHVIGGTDARSLATETAKIEAGKPRRHRCDSCPK